MKERGSGGVDWKERERERERKKRGKIYNYADQRIYGYIGAWLPVRNWVGKWCRWCVFISSENVHKNVNALYKTLYWIAIG